MGETPDGNQRPRLPSMLRDLAPRAVSAAVLGTVAILATWAGQLSFAALVLVVGLLMSWEWSRMVRGGGQDGLLMLHLATTLLAAVLCVLGHPHYGLLAILIGAVAMYWVAPQPNAGLSSLGVAYVGLPVMAMIWLRGTDGLGAWAICFIFAIVWTTDTFAYFCGRMIGGPKLCPAISPGKTWSGTIGGLLSAAVAGALFAYLLPRPAPVELALIGLLLSVVAQIGDLAESALKRMFAVKNSSDLIPGHGGFMDRMDGAVTAACVAAVVAAWRATGSPAQSLLLWN